MKNDLQFYNFRLLQSNELACITCAVIYPGTYLVV